MVVVKTSDNTPTDFVASDHEGIDYDVNPRTGNVCEPSHVLPNGSVIYCDDLRKGGDGSNWARTPRNAVAQDAARGIRTKWPSQSVRVNRKTFLPSETYSSRYEEVFGHP
jgi:hypothetical protein